MYKSYHYPTFLQILDIVRQFNFSHSGGGLWYLIVVLIFFFFCLIVSCFIFLVYIYCLFFSFIVFFLKSFYEIMCSKHDSFVGHTLWNCLLSSLSFIEKFNFIFVFSNTFRKCFTFNFWAGNIHTYICTYMHIYI